MGIMVTLDFPLQDGKQAEFLKLLGGVLPDTRAFDGCIKVETLAEEDGKSVILIEEWASKKHQETYFQWRVDTGLVDVLGPFIIGPPVTRYYKIYSE
ncbi:MAG: antibiotic biosynthesis monooxygenase [Paracoccaceae bacterium]|nr:antibiotic biosynthesis monooxygenase [Paracoccaceae bacterium]